MMSVRVRGEWSFSVLAAALLLACGSDAELPGGSGTDEEDSVADGTNEEVDAVEQGDAEVLDTPDPGPAPDVDAEVQPPDTDSGLTDVVPPDGDSTEDADAGVLEDGSGAGDGSGGPDPDVTDALTDAGTDGSGADADVGDATDAVDGGDSSDAGDAGTDSGPRRCGDSIVQAPEQCDDGNDSSLDDCTILCTRPRCGDGLLSGGEQCDDGNPVGDDGCSNSCRLPSCGDGVRQASEQCDDGNTVDEDACTNACTIPRCGDGVVSDYERRQTLDSPRITNPSGSIGYVCDDGGTCPASSCSVADRPSAPEHGMCQTLGFQRAENVVWGGGLGGTSTPMPHAYNWSCTNYVCSRGSDQDSRDNCTDSEMLRTLTCFEGVTEECDQGAANSDAPNAGCRTDCTLPACGDGVVDAGEECDDANGVARDGCTACRLPVCGDGVVEPGEPCDDGNDLDSDACVNSCQLASCGDGIIGRFEAVETFTSPRVTNPAGRAGRVCDDGGTCPAGRCTVATNGSAPEHGICQALGYDRAVSVVWGGGEGQADNPMPHAFNWTCTNFVCRASTQAGTADDCGAGEMLNSIVCQRAVNEVCDAGELNGTEGAECSTQCRPPGCGDGTVDAGEECDDGNTDNTDSCTLACRAPACGDGLLQGTLGEQCDLGVANSNAAGARCSTDCLLPADFLACEATNIGTATGTAVATGNTSAAANNESGTCGGSDAGDARVVWIAPRAGRYTVSTNSSSFDTILYARLASDGSCGGRQLGCDDDEGAGNQSQIVIDVQQGDVVLIIVDGYATRSGAWTLNITGS